MKVSVFTYINENKNLKTTEILLTYLRVILAITYKVIINCNANHNASGRLPKMFYFITQNKYNTIGTNVRSKRYKGLKKISCKVTPNI